MNARDALKRAGVVTGVAAGVVGAVYGAERAVSALVRHRGGPDDEWGLDPVFDQLDVVYTHDGGRLVVISRGSGPPILFVHGVTLSSRVWAKQFASVPAAGFRAVAFDGRGHGQSTLGETGHSVQNLALDLQSVLEDLDLRDVLLVGHSMGGMAALAFVLHHRAVVRERVRGLVLMNTTARVRGEDARRLRRLLEPIIGALPDVGLVLRRKNLGFLVVRMGFGDDALTSHVEVTRQMLAACSSATVRDATKMLLGFDVVDQLGQVDLPTLVLAGTRDVVTPAARGRGIASAIPGSRLEEFPGAGHMLMYERTADVDKLIVEFARECLE